VKRETGKVSGKESRPQFLPGLGLSKAKKTLTVTKKKGRLRRGGGLENRREKVIRDQCAGLANAIQARTIEIPDATLSLGGGDPPGANGHTYHPVAHKG